MCKSNEARQEESYDKWIYFSKPTGPVQKSCVGGWLNLRLPVLKSVERKVLGLKFILETCGQSYRKLAFRKIFFSGA
jgi:hypothetical protein